MLIATGVYKPGERLPREEDLAERFQVSRGVVRESIRGLEERGMTFVRHGVGAFVTKPQEWDILDADVLEALLHAPGASELIVELIAVQRLLEVEAARAAAERQDPDHFTALGAALADLRRAAKSPFHAADFPAALIALHRAILAAAERRVLARTCAPLYEALTIDDALGFRQHDLAAATVRELAAVVRAIVAGDPEEAATLMDGYLSALSTRISGGL
jgi:GntR family transcriptional repressor for pyruvate dehydrogenase complex